MQMLEEGTTRSVLEDHNSCERLVACAVTKQVQHVLVVHSGQDRYLKQERLMFSKVRHTTLQQWKTSWLDHSFGRVNWSGDYCYFDSAW